MNYLELSPEGRSQPRANKEHGPVFI